MEAKLLEIRDDGTHMVVLAVRLVPADAREGHLLKAAGFGATPEDQGEYIVVASVKGGVEKATTDPFKHSLGGYRGPRTLRVAHEHLQEAWDDVRSGAVVDVEYLLGETSRPKDPA